MRSKESEKNMPKDWHIADINCAIQKSGTNMSKLAKAHGLARGTLRNAFYRHCPKYEKIIANAMGVEPKDIWVSRYSK